MEKDIRLHYSEPKLRLIYLYRFSYNIYPPNQQCITRVPVPMNGSVKKSSQNITLMIAPGSVCPLIKIKNSYHLSQRTYPRSFPSHALDTTNISRKNLEYDIFNQEGLVYISVNRWE